MAQFTTEEKESIEKAKQSLIIESKNGDIECAHGNADDILCNLLKTFGLTEVVELYDKVDKWYH